MKCQKLLISLFFISIVMYTPFELSAQNNGRYLEAGIENDRAFEKWFKKLKQAIERNDRTTLSEMLHFPLDLRINKQDIKIRNKKDFFTYYPQIFTKEFRETVISQRPRDLKISTQGVMVGNGNIWINAIEGKKGYWITALNN